MAWRVCAVLVAIVPLVTGCGGKEPSATARGVVLLDGQPLAGAEVQFIPKGDPSLGSHTVTTGADGSFTLQPEAANTPVRAGSYVVVVNKLAPGDPSKGGGMDGMRNLVPETYRVQSSTPLQAEIKAGENTLTSFALDSKAKRPAGNSNANMQMK